MIYPVRVKSFDPKGLLRFELREQSLDAAHDIDPNESQGMLEPGATCPLTLSVKATKVEYVSKQERSFEKLSTGAAGDIVRIVGRVADYFAHDAVRLDGTLSLAVKLAAPQSATDFRRGSWLEAQGVLHVSLPAHDH